MREWINKRKAILVSPSLRSIWNWSAGHRKGILLCSLGNILTALLGLLFTLATKGLVDGAVSGNLFLLEEYVAALMMIIVLELLLAFLMRIGSTKLRAGMLRDMRSMVITRVMHKEYGSLAAIHSGELTNKILSDAQTVTDGIVGIVPSMLCLATEFLGAVAILFHLNRSFVLLLILAGCVGAVMIYVFGRKSKKYHKEIRLREDKVHAILQETLQNLRIIKASGIEMQRVSNVRERQDEYVEAQMKRGRFSALSGTGINMLFRFSWLYAMVWGCICIYHGTMTYGTLTAMLQLVGQVQGPIAELSSVVSKVFGTISSAERLDEILHLPEEETETESEKTLLEQGFQNFEIRELSFSYGREKVLQNVDLTVNAGDIAAITGDSGCGKSTLFLLLLGLYRPTEGKIFFLGKNGIQKKGKAPRGLFSYVPQGNALFSGTLKENISMFRSDASEAEIWNAAKMACIDEFILSLENGMDTLVGEKGLGLSEGQAQRVAVARALLSDAPILLLDEATSALDDKTEAKLLENIKNLHNKTCLIVTHRPAALGICNRKFVIEVGKMMETQQRLC